MNAHTTDTQLVVLDLASLRIWKGNPRKTIPDLTDLIASVRKLGVLQPLLVRPLDYPVPAADVPAMITHEVVAGQCRFLAATAAELASVPCTVRDIDDATALEIGLTENAGRNDPHPLEDAEALDTLVRQHGRSVEHVADRIGRPATWVRRRLSLLKLIPAARAWLREGRLPVAHAQQLAAVGADVQARVVERYKTADIPTSKRFGEDIVAALRTLASAPFDREDATLSGGSCDGCAKRSDAQRDLFGDAGTGRCLDGACWDGKVAHTWARARADATARRLVVIDQPVQVSWGGDVISDAGGSYTTAAPAGAKVAAVARDAHGAVVELYSKDTVQPRAAPQAADEDDAAEIEQRAAEREASALQRKQAAAEEKRATIARLVAAAETPRGLALVQRVAIEAFVKEFDAADLQRACEAMQIGTRFSTPAQNIEAARPDELAHLLAVTVASFWALDPDAEDESPWQKALRAAMKAPTTTEPAAPPQAAAEPERSVRVWIRERDWDRLSEDDHEALTTPDVGVDDIEWRGAEGFITADVPESVMGALRAAAKARKVGVHEGADPPAAKAKAARKASKQPADADPATGPDASHTRVETIKDVDAITARDDASAEAREAGSMRVVILTDAGNWGAARKGLAAWDATKTPGAGSQSGGACSPLVMLYTPATESPDVETLLKRLAKEKRSFLDLGVVASGGVHDIAPSNRSVRERWNAAHPGKAVAVKGGSK